MTIPPGDTSIMATKLTEATDYGSLASLVPSWERSLRAANKSPRTLRSYGDSARPLDAFLRDRLQVLHQLAFHDLLRGAGRARIEQGRTLGEELGALALTAEFDHTLVTYHAIAYELDAASVALDRALEKARRYRLLELATLGAGLRATIAAMRGQRRDAERQVAETLATVHDLGPLKPSGGSRTLRPCCHPTGFSSSRRFSAASTAWLRSFVPHLGLQSWRRDATGPSSMTSLCIRASVSRVGSSLAVRVTQPGQWHCSLRATTALPKLPGSGLSIAVTRQRPLSPTDGPIPPHGCARPKSSSSTLATSLWR